MGQYLLSTALKHGPLSVLQVAYNGVMASLQGLLLAPPNYPLRDPKIPSNKHYKARNRAILGGAGRGPY